MIMALTPEQQLKLLTAIWRLDRDGWVFMPWIDGSIRDRNERRRRGWHEGPAFKWPEDRSKILDHLRGHEDDDLYFCPQIFNGRKRDADLVDQEQTLYADLDDRLHPDDCESKGVPQPSLAWETSPGRYQAAWLMRLPKTGATWPGFENHRLTDHLGADPGGWDATQVLRVPGRRNHKPDYDTPQQGRFLRDSSTAEKHSWSAFDDLPEVEVYEGADDIDDDEIDSLDHDQVWAKIQKEHRGKPKFIKLSGMKSSDDDSSDRSDRIWEMARLMDELGRTPAEAFVIIRASVWGESRQDRPYRLKEDIAKAFAKSKQDDQPTWDKDGQRRPKITWANEIDPKPVTWAWVTGDEGRLPAGTLSIAGGREGTGKSSFGIWLTAQITRGKLPGSFKGRRRRVALCGHRGLLGAHAGAPAHRRQGGPIDGGPLRRGRAGR
jgi:hypothetical protein